MWCPASVTIENTRESVFEKRLTLVHGFRDLSMVGWPGAQSCGAQHLRGAGSVQWGRDAPCMAPRKQCGGASTPCPLLCPHNKGLTFQEYQRLMIKPLGATPGLPCHVAAHKGSSQARHGDVLRPIDTVPSLKFLPSQSSRHGAEGAGQGLGERSPLLSPGLANWALWLGPGALPHSDLALGSSVGHSRPSTEHCSALAARGTACLYLRKPSSSK